MQNNDNNNVKHISDIVGEWGKWQMHFNIFCTILWGATALNNMGYSFHAFDVEFWCSDVPLDYQNKTSEMKCNKFTNPNESCTQWTYDRTQFEQTIKTEFDLVCHRSNYASFTQSAYMLGYTVSGLVFAYYSDKYGRRPLIWVSFVAELLALISCATSVNIYQYIISRFILGMGSSGKGLAIYTIQLECLGPKYRSDIAILSNLGWVLGYATIPGIALWLKNFRYMQLLSFVAMMLMMVWYYVFYESPRWLITNGQLDRAEVILRKAIKQNGLSDVDLKARLIQLRDHMIKSENADNSKAYTVLDLLKTKNLRKYTLIFWYSWSVMALLYYGFSFNMSDFGGNFYLTFLLSGLVELPANLFTLFALKYVGRRNLFLFFTLVLTFSTLAIIPSKNEYLKVGFALLGKSSVTSAWNVMAIHGPEVFPTVLRHTGLGSSSVVGRIGSIAAPYMTNLASITSLTFVMAFYSTLTAINAILILFLPETKGQEIPDTIAEAERLGDQELNLFKSNKKT